MFDGLVRFYDQRRWRNFQGNNEDIGWEWKDDHGNQWTLYDTYLNGMEFGQVDSSDDPLIDGLVGDGEVWLYDNDDQWTNGNWTTNPDEHD